ncbi:MAG TPA: ATP-binding protein [Tepidisphaeraceae bacterium]|nr:ATP-binding protein [Tepidisphaeraceae bacterium]
MSSQSAILDPPSAQRPVASEQARRIDELGRLLIAYGGITERLQESHNQLTATVQNLRAELSEKNRLLDRKKRLAALGEMAAGMAHEIRNPLGGIQLYASMLAKDVADRGESVDLVRKISGGVKRIDALVGQVLQFTRELNVHAEQVDLAQVVEQAVEYAAPALAERNVRCVVNGPSSMPVNADPLLLGQAILNLLLNAAQAIGPQGGVATIEYGPPSDRAPARQFSLIVRDTGPGIPSGVLDRIFDPFFTTKDEGTGLGLSIVHRVIEAHDGTITASNDPAGGAKFEIRV